MTWIDDRHTVAQLRRGDNFCYLLRDPEGDEAVVVDPGYPDLLDPICALDLPVRWIVNTHGHPDHVGGNAVVAKHYGAQIARFGAGDRPLADGDHLRLGAIDLDVLHTPGHMDDAICLRWGSYLLTGDTLFLSSCGNAYGRDNQHKIWQSLSRIEKLPGETTVLIGHDYAVTALDYMLLIEPDNTAARAKQAEVRAARESGAPILTTLAQEYEHNPFFRLHTEAMRAFLQERCGQVPDDLFERFCLLRDLRNA